MSISFRCEHCGKKVEAPDSAGGRRGKCPYCKQSNYIPMPVSEDELFELAPEEDEPPRSGPEAEAISEQERALIAEIGGAYTGRVPLEQREGLKTEDLHPFVVNYCLDLSDSRLDRAGMHLTELRKVPKIALAAVDEFLSGQALEPALDKIPPKILQGFLTQLRKELA